MGSHTVVGASHTGKGMGHLGQVESEDSQSGGLRSLGGFPVHQQLTSGHLAE